MRTLKPSPYLLFVPWVVLILGLALTYISQNMARESARKALYDEFDSRVNEIVQYIDRRLHSYEQILAGGVGLFASSDSVGKEAFADYLGEQNIESRYPGIQGVGFSQWIPPQDKARHIAKIRAEGFPGYNIRPPGQRDAYTSIIYLEPFNWRNQRAFGYDMYTEPVRHLAMARARDEGEARMSGKVQLVQETEQDAQAGFLLYVPVYRRHSPHQSLAERRANLIGWVYAPFRMNDLINGILGRWSQEIIPSLDFEIYDGEGTDKQRLMFDTGKLSEIPNPEFHAIKPLALFGRQWTIAVHSLPSFEARLRYDKANAIAVGGTVGSILLALVVWLLVNGRARALALAENMTSELRQSESEQRRLNRALRLLSSCNVALVHAEAEHQLLNEICRLIVEVGGYRMAWVGYAEHDEAQTVLPIARYGYEEGYLDTARITWADTEHGRGPTGTAIRTGEPQVNLDFSNNPQLAPWRDDALKRGYQSSTALPLKDQSGVFGVLTIYAAEREAFNEAENQLMEELAGDLAFGIGSLRSDAARRQAEEALRGSEERLRELNLSLERRVQEEVAKNREKDLLLIQQSRMATMGEMMRSVAHHWRQPLNALNLILANIKDAYEYGELSRETLDAMVTDGNRVAQKMSATIDDFRSFFQTSEQSMRFNLVEVIREVASLMEATFKNEQITLTLDARQDVFVDGVLNELAQVLLNVLLNAKDAIKGKSGQGNVHIGLALENNRGVIRVRDDGGGIPENVLPKIFDPYFTTKETGSGIGLYMSRMILERMKGRIEAHNVDGGAEIVVSIPSIKPESP